MSTISNSWGAMTALTSRQTDNVTPTGTDFNKAPTALDPEAFRTWSRTEQLRYIDARGTGSPKEVKIGPVDGEQITASVAEMPTVLVKTVARFVNNNQVESPKEIVQTDPGRPATAEEMNASPSILDGRTFLSWNREDQYAYLAKQGRGAVGAAELVIGSTATAVRVSAVRDVAIEGSVVFGSGKAADIPYYQLSGSSSGTPSKFVMDQAEALFPTLDGQTHRLAVIDRPEGFYTDPHNMTATEAQTLAGQFTKWHSAYQLEYVKFWGSGVPQPNLNIPTSGTPLLTAFVSQTDPTKLFILNGLQKGDFAKMSLADQMAAAALPGFSTIASKLGLTNITSPSVPKPTNTAVNVDAKSAVLDLNTYINDKKGEPFTTTLTQASNLAQPPNTTVGNVQTTYVQVPDPILLALGLKKFEKTERILMPPADKSYFTNQLAILTEQLNSMGVVAPADVSKKLTELKDRFDRAFAFLDVRPPTISFVNKGDDGTADDRVAVYRDVISRDEPGREPNATIIRGYQIFIAQEKRISELAEARMQIVRDNGALFGQQLDVPSLVFRFQSLYNLQLEAQVVMETEEINQQNDLLKTYAAIQDLISLTLSKFEKADGDAKRIKGLDVNDYHKDDKLSVAERKLMSMFEDSNGTGQLHPLERLRKINRPKQDFFSQWSDGDNRHYDLNAFTHLTWSAYATRLSEAVTIINQNSQIKMNDINSMDKQRNRHFELANSALSKMNEIVSSIARAS